MALYFYFNETTGDLVYSDQATYSGSGYTSLGQQTNVGPTSATGWIFNSQRANIKTVTKDPNISGQIDVLKRTSGMFYNCRALTSLDLSGFDTSNVEDMSIMFYGCSALTSLDLSDFDTSNVTYMSNMFNGCSALASLNLSSFDTSNVTSMNYMFNGCSALTSLDLSGFDTSNVTNMYNMFNYCIRLISLDLSSFNTSKLTNPNNVFSQNYDLRIIDISPNMSNVLLQLPYATYYDVVTRKSYDIADIPGGSTYVLDLADLDLVSTMVQDRAAIKAAEHRLDARLRSLQKQIDVLKG